jgi:hypothetical protein
MSFQSKALNSTTPRPWLWTRLSIAPANLFEITGHLVQCERSSQSDAAKNGEGDPAHFHEQALVPFGIEDISILVFRAVSGLAESGFPRRAEGQSLGG